MVLYPLHKKRKKKRYFLDKRAEHSLTTFCSSQAGEEFNCLPSESISYANELCSH